MAVERARGADTLAVVVPGAAIAFLVALATRPVIASDDAAISFRYAERLATGRGLTYNDGESVLGASSGLQTLLLAAARWFGVSVPTAAVVLGAIGTAVCATLIGLIAVRLGGWVAAAVAIALFVAAPTRWHATSGLESATLAAACLATVLARQTGRDRIAGVALGLALVAKLDAASLLVAVVVASVLVGRGLPLATLAFAGATAAPWFLWVSFRFGSPLPQSLRSKVSGRADAPGYRWDPTWALQRFRAFVPAAAVGLVVWVVAARRTDVDGQRETRLVLAIWFVLAALAASLLPMGATYPWYLTSIYPPAALLAGDAVNHLVRSRPTSTWVRVLMAVGLLAVAVSLGAGARTVVAEVADGRTPGPAELQAGDFRAAGEHVRDAHRGALVQSCFGWVAYAALDATIADPCGLNSTRAQAARTPDVIVETVDGVDPQERPGWCDEARFASAASAHPTAPAVVVRVPC